MAISEVPKIESNVIQLMPSNVREPLEAFTRTLRLSDFFDALKAIAPLKMPIDPLIKTWEAHLYEFAAKLPTHKQVIQSWGEARKQFEIDIAPFTAIVDWLAQFELDPGLRKIESESDKNEGSPSENTLDETDDPEEIDGLEVPHMSDSELNAIADSVIQIDIESDKLWRNAKDKYPSFPAAWPLESVLPEYFGDDDPAVFIAQFMATFYQVQERGTGCHIGDNWDDGFKFKLINIHNPGWREFVEGNLIDNLIALETMHWMNEENISEICKINPELIDSGEAVIKDLVGMAEDLNEKGTGDASVKAGQLLMLMHGIRIDAWMKDVIETRKAKEIRDAVKEELDETEEDGDSTEYDDEETVESKRNLARIQGLSDVLPLVKGIVFCGAKHGDYPGPFSDEFEFSELPRLLPLLPQAMFERVIYWASAYRDDDFDDIDQFFYSGNAAFLDVILSWPMDEEAFSWGDFDHPVLRGKLWGEKIHDIAPFDKVPHMNIPLLERIYLNWFSAWEADNIIAAARQAKENVLSPTGHSIQRLSYLIEHSIERISHARRITYAGLSPFSMDSAAQLGSDLSKLCPLIKLTPKHDLSYLLAAWDDGGFGRSPFASRVYKQDTPEITQSYAQDRAANYMRVFHAAVEEGWDEFANAALAFFLFSQPIHFERRFWVDWRDLGAALRLAPTLNGYHRVKRALEVAGAMICSDGQGHYDALCLAAWVPADAPPVELPADFTGVAVSKRTIIEQGLVECLGSETWLKLGPKAKRQLKDAELLWSKLHPEAGRGMEDWGSLATAYVKVIEGELGRRLSDVLMSDAFRNDHTRAKGRPPEPHITLGAMLYLFKEFELRDQALKDLIIAANIHLQDDVTLINHLLKIMHYRNRGAHPEGLSVIEFMKLRQLLFREGVLKRFIDLL